MSSTTDSGFKLSVMLVKEGVFMGDHAQDVVTAVEVRDDETIAEAAARLLRRQEYTSYPMSSHMAAQYDWRLEVRMVQPAPADGTESDTPSCDAAHERTFD